MSASTTHDVKIGGVGYLVRPGSYRKHTAPLMGSRFTTGDPDYSQLGPFQHWVQQCWIGGMGQDSWTDDAMYFSGVGVDSTVHGRLSLTRDLARGVGAGWTLDGTKVTREFAVYGGDLYCLVNNASGDGKLYKYTKATDLWALSKTFTGSLVRSICVWGNSLMVGSTTDKLYRLNSGTWGTVAFPTGMTDTVYAMMPFKDRLYVAFAGGSVWRLKSNKTWDGSVAFFDMPDSGYVRAFEIHLGFLYMLSTSAIIYRSDGNNTGEIWRSDPGSQGRTMRSYDGRLFVLLFEASGSGVREQSVLYQLSGSAMTELKRYGKVGKSVDPGSSMVILGGRLFYGASALFALQDGFGIAVYDATEDGHSIFASQMDTTTYADASASGVGWSVDDIIIFDSKVFISVRDHGIFKTPFTFLDYMSGIASATYDVAGSSFGGGWLVSSVYDAGTPGLLKLWPWVNLDVEIPAYGCQVFFDYSIDGGKTWVLGSITSFVTGQTGRRRIRTSLGQIRSSSLRYRLRLKSTSSAATPVVYSVAVAYIPLPDPQWQWEMTLVISELQELLDGTTVGVSSASVLTALEALYRSMSLVTFVDVDGTSHASAVLITDMAESIYVTDAPIEGEVKIQLLEASEA